ncbi:DUF1127 domain-containing protein [Falsiroseomonas oryziterrae]|uniref:DUF1127 domain-containing protein n=1 Tax=Falsiroseomonas oryziterrae TaxID=2911368 RepID=UPI001F19E5B8|nr:DUF1127 domain-containing protein [Roseomonas sp. NPKOSM-4]
MTRHRTHRLPFIRTIAAWRARAEERCTLLALTDRELRDIGISHGEAVAEARKPFWIA